MEIEKIPEIIEKIAKNRAYSYYRNYRYKLRGFCDYEDFLQIIYEKLVKDGLWECNDHSLIAVCANRACIDFIRANVYGFRKKIHGNFNLVEYEDELVNIFDSRYYEIASLNMLLARLPKMKKFISERIIQNYTLKEIGGMVNLTEARICQLKKEIIKRLIELSKEDFKQNQFSYKGIR